VIHRSTTELSGDAETRGIGRGILFFLSTILKLGTKNYSHCATSTEIIWFI
jgi:hypothetical protein